MQTLAAIGIHSFPIFLASSLALSMLPGPATMYIVGRSIAEGRRAGLISVLGISTGSAVHVLAVAFGLSALLAASQTAFEVLKFAGAAYLIYLGLRSFFGRTAGGVDAADAAAPRNNQAVGRKAYAQGTVTQILNPKASLFFLAILPQFVALSSRHSPVPFLVLGAAFVAIDTCWFSIVASGSAHLTGLLRASQRRQRAVNVAAGTIYVGLGIGLLRARARFAH